jgi:galactose mutarotase-like enzyme
MTEVETLVLEDGDARVAIAPARGGLVTRFRRGDDEILYLDEATLLDPTKNVRGGVPILFPIAGKLAGDGYVVDGVRYAMKQHGFARNLPWRVTRQAAASATLELRSTDDTRAVYPFEFVVELSCAIEAGDLVVRQRFMNVGDRPMPIQPGVHPYFRVADATKAQAGVVTDATRGRDNRTGELVAVRSPLELTAAELDLHLLDPVARTTRLVRPGLKDLVVERGADERVVVVWTLAGKDFVCVEPWSRAANALHDGTAIVVAPGGVHETLLQVGTA